MAFFFAMYFAIQVIHKINKIYYISEITENTKARLSH